MLCTEHGIDPHGVYEKHLGDLKEMCGVERDVIANDGVMPGKKPPPQMVVLECGEARRAADTASISPRRTILKPSPHHSAYGRQES